MRRINKKKNSRKKLRRNNPSASQSVLYWNGLQWNVEGFSQLKRLPENPIIIPTSEIPRIILALEQYMLYN